MSKLVHVPKAQLATRRTLTADEKQRLDEAMAGLLANLESDASRRGYEGDWGRFLQWITLEGVHPLDVRPLHVQNYLLHLRDAKKAKATRGRALSVVREVYAAFCRAELIPMNPAREVKNPRVDSAPRTPWPDEAGLEKLLGALSGESWRERRDRLCVLLIVGLGKRRSEVARMRVEDFRDGAVYGTVKRGKETVVGVPEWLQKEIEEWTAGRETGPLLPRDTSKFGCDRPISGDTVHDIVKGAAKRAGLPEWSIAPHGLRRSYITLLGKMGVPLKERQLAVSHESSSTTERYDRAREAAENAPGELFGEMVKKARGK